MLASVENALASAENALGSIENDSQTGNPVGNKCRKDAMLASAENAVASAENALGSVENALASVENDSQTGRGQRAPKRATLKNSLFSVMIAGSASG